MSAGTLCPQDKMKEEFLVEIIIKNITVAKYLSHHTLPCEKQLNKWGGLPVSCHFIEEN